MINRYSSWFDGNKNLYDKFKNDLHLFNENTLKYFLRIACENNDIEMVRSLLKHKIDCTNGGLLEACKNGNNEIAKLLLSKSTMFFSDAIPYAYKNCSRDIVLELMDRCFGYGDYLSNVCITGDMDLVKMALKNKKNHPDLGCACLGGNIDVVRLMIDLGAKNYDHGLCGACEGGHINIVKMMIYLGAKDLHEGFATACIHGHTAVVELLLPCVNINICEDYYEQNYFYHVCLNNSIDIVRLLLKRDVCEQVLNGGLIGTCEGNNTEIMNLLLLDKRCDYNAGLYGACCGGHIELVKMFLSLGATDIKNGLYGAYTHSHIDVVELLMTREKSYDFFFEIEHRCMTVLFYCKYKKHLEINEDIEQFLCEIMSDEWNRLVYNKLFMPKMPADARHTLLKML
jgi:ankyrin repeat protein